MPAMRWIRILVLNSCSAYVHKFPGLDGVKHSQDFGAVRQQIHQAVGFSTDQDYRDASLLQILLVLKATVKREKDLKT